ncbi:Phosphocholine transferase AnkX [Roseimaritima multifibrata]|uniref:Phosphocholine transferase AnkX n=1 Tax=Roseimaritima multifibrata TaxID=1930274 RepID=A0A517M9F3_9BACT|nr:ankyrin repeat domain-containing protein [Roseimaritima multifibrata]QDS91417.1 Phosphocholine transferase AnkX [Roseimaritima multifibrata]
MLPEYELIQSIQEGRNSGIDEAISKGATVDARSLSGLTVLEVAQKYGRFNTGRELIKRGADIHQIIGQNGDTLLHRAARTGDIGFTTLLLESGADPDAVNTAGKSPLHYAANGGFQYLAHELIRAGASVDLATPAGDTALHFAAKKGHVPMIRSLLDPAADADAFAKNNTGYTPLHEAAAAGKTEAVTLLIDKSRIGSHAKATLLPRIRRAAELHGHLDTAQAILAAEASASPSSSFRSSTDDSTGIDR